MVQEKCTAAQRKFIWPKLSWSRSWTEMQGKTKRVSNTILGEVSEEIIPACYRMKMVTSQTRDKEEVLNAFYAFVLNIADGLRPSSALSWRNMAVGMTSSQLTVKQCGTSCSRWTLINLWGLVDSPESTQRAG